jgi:hypothetical protein
VVSRLDLLIRRGPGPRNHQQQTVVCATGEIGEVANSRCPLMVIRRHPVIAELRRLLLRKQTSPRAVLVSAWCHFRTFACRAHLKFAPRSK